MRGIHRYGSTGLSSQRSTSDHSIFLLHLLFIAFSQKMISFMIHDICSPHISRHYVLDTICRQYVSVFEGSSFDELLPACYSGLILGLRTANERRRYFVTTPLIGWAQALNQPCYYYCLVSVLCIMPRHATLPAYIYQSPIYHENNMFSTKLSSENDRSIFCQCEI